MTTAATAGLARPALPIAAAAASQASDQGTHSLHLRAARTPLIYCCAATITLAVPSPPGGRQRCCHRRDRHGPGTSAERCRADGGPNSRWPRGGQHAATPVSGYVRNQRGRATALHAAADLSRDGARARSASRGPGRRLRPPARLACRSLRRLSRRPDDAAEAQVAGRGVDGLRHPGGGPVAAAVVRRAQVRAALHDLARNARRIIRSMLAAWPRSGAGVQQACAVAA